MNRLTSIICALCIILSANAQQRVHLPKTVKNNKQQVEQRLNNARSDNERLMLTYKYKTALRNKNAATPEFVQSRAPKAKQEVVAVTIDRFTTFYSAEENKVFYGLHQEDGNSFFFDIKLDEGKHDIEWNKEYTLADMNAESSEWDSEDEFDETVEHFYTAVSFRKTKGEGYDVHITASVTDVDGNQFTLAYDEQPLVPTGESVDVNINRPLNSYDYIESDHSWILRANDNTYYVDLRFFSSDSQSPAGQFGADDIDLSSTYINIVTDQLDEYDDPISKTVNAKDASITVTDNGSRIDVNASMLGDDGIMYQITLFFALPEVQAKEVLNANNLNIDEWALSIWGELGLFASDEDGKSISLNLFPEDPDAGILGTYEISPNSANNGAISQNEEQFVIYSGSITIQQQQDKYLVTGTVLAWNNVEYTLNLTTPDPVLTQQAFDADNLVIDLYPVDGFFEVSGFDNDKSRFLLLTVNTQSVSGHFTTDDIDDEYTYLETNQGDSYIFLDADINVSYLDGNATITGTLTFINENDKYDLLQLTLNAQAGPYVPSVRNVTVDAFSFVYTVDQSVGYTLICNEGAQKFGFNFKVDKWDADIQFDKAYTLADLLQSGSYGINNEEREYIVYESLTFTKTKTDDNVAITATVIDSRGNTWNITYQGEDAEIESIFVELGQANPLAHADGGIEYELVDVDNSLSCHLVLPTIPNDEEDVENDRLYDSEAGEIDLQLSYLSIQKIEHKIIQATIEKSENDGAVSVTANIVDDRGFKYCLSYYDDGFVLTGDTVQIVLHQQLEAVYWEEYYQWMLRAENDSVIVSFSIYSTESELKTGEYGEFDIDIYSSHIEFLLDAEENNWSYIMFHAVEAFEIQGDQANGYSLIATVIGEDGIVYEINIDAQVEAIPTISSQTLQTTKRLVNGNIVIEKDGIIYNLQGAVIERK